MPTPPGATPPPEPKPGASADVGEIGRRVLAGRESRHMNQQELADKANLSRAYISRLERGLIPNPTITELGKIAEALDTTLAALTASPPRLTEMHLSYEWDEIQRQVEGLPPELREQILKIARQSIEIATGATDLARRN